MMNRWWPSDRPSDTASTRMSEEYPQYKAESPALLSSANLVRLFSHNCEERVPYLHRFLHSSWQQRCVRVAYANQEHGLVIDNSVGHRRTVSILLPLHR